MDSIGDIIYVIAIIAWVIYSFVSKANKQSKRKQAPSDSQRKEDLNENTKRILEQLLGKQEEEKEEVIPEVESRKSSIEPEYDSLGEKITTYEGKAINPVEDYEFGKYKSQETLESPYEKINLENNKGFIFDNNNSKEEETIEVTHLDDERSEIAEEFDIEKAIIYSEILKRPAWVF